MSIRRIMHAAISIIVCFIATFITVEPFGFVRTPLARTSIFREPSWGAQPPFWLDDVGVWCGNVRQDLQYSTCGRCGDAPGYSHAAQGGRYDKGIITGTFTAGQVLEVTVELVTNLRGHFEFDLCPQDTEDDYCFQQLNIIGGDRQVRNLTMMCTGSGGEHPTGPLRSRLYLPPGIRCNRCTLRWTYRTSLPPALDACFNPDMAQTFRNCVDIDQVQGYSKCQKSSTENPNLNVCAVKMSRHFAHV